MIQPTLHYTSLDLLNETLPKAMAYMIGNDRYPKLNGTVRFYPLPHKGIIIEAEFFHLPDSMNGDPNGFFGFHIHEKGDCSDSFQNTGNHYNPQNKDHPFHAGDLPPLMSNSGYAWTAFFDDRITIQEILNRSVIVHRMPDDFTTQPSGDSGEKIACGIIRAL